VEGITRGPLATKTWRRLKDNAKASVLSEGAVGRKLGLELRHLQARGGKFQLQLVGHSTGAFLVGHLAKLLTTQNSDVTEGGKSEKDLTIRQCALLAPACSVEFFVSTFLPLRTEQAIEDLVIFNLTPEAEKKDPIGLYSRSLLTLVQERMEAPPRPILGLSRSAKANTEVSSQLQSGTVRLVETPNAFPETSGKASRAKHHGEFSEDEATLQSLVLR
jgi:hypothetical protein